MKRLLLFVLFVCSAVELSMSQSVEVVEQFKEVPNSSVIAAYSNEFASEIKEYGDAETGDFKFVVIRMNLEGDAAEAKNKVTLNCPTQRLEKTYKEKSNQMLFLFPYEAKTIFVDCGDGCERKQLISGKQLRSNTVYETTVKYTAKKQNAYMYYEPEISSQYIVFNLNPKDAVVRVNGEIWQSDDGVAIKMMPIGKYDYTVTAKDYHEKSGSVNLGTEKQTVSITLIPAFGWISVESNAIMKGADVYVDNIKIGQVPVTKHKVSSGNHKVEVIQKKYKTYTTQINVTDNATIPVNPVMQADFAKLTFKVANNAEIWINNKKIGDGTIEYELASGSYVVETKLKGHKGMTYPLNVQPSMNGQTMELPAPLPIYGIMNIDVRPMDATIYIDGKNMGVTPIVLPKVLIGEHYVKITKAGYADKNETVVIRENETYTLSGTLIKQELSNNSSRPVTDNTPMQSSTGMTVTDCQGHTYPVVKIGSQYWMAENLQCTKYDTQSERAGAKIYTSSSATYAPYYIDGRYANTEYSGYLTNGQREHLGLLYNWAAAMGYATESQAQNQTGSYSGRRQGICPNGWYLPNRADWNTLANALGGVPKTDSDGTIDYPNVGAKLKSRSGWYSGGNGTDDYGFSGLPAGYANGSSVDSVGRWGLFWSSDAKSSVSAYYRFLRYDSSYLIESSDYESSAQSVRCLRD
ncbi:MAG: PEGA domain-containing protein [Paludibacteraceae bacterium]|nr:PEGA domain-containing protein [Paludibacteraceae bacterium]